MSATLYRDRIERIAARYSLAPDLVEAIVVIESSGQTDAFKFEPGYWRRYCAGKPEWESWIPRRVASSYGLLQCMYPTALLNGWEGEPEELFLPDVGLNAGCARLRYLLDWSMTFDATPEARLSAALAAYNGGQLLNKPTDHPLRNQSYVVKVRRAWTKITGGTGTWRA